MEFDMERMLHRHIRVDIRHIGLMWPSFLTGHLHLGGMYQAL